MFITYNTNYPVSTSTASPLFRTKSVTQSSGSAIGAQIRISFHRTNSTALPIYYSCDPGQVYTFSFYMSDILMPSPSITARIRFYNSAASATVLSTTTSTSTISTASYTRVSVTATAPTSITASLNGNLIFPDFFCPTNTTSSYSGGRFLADGILLEASPALNEYFDGSFTGASWSGTADISSSSLLYASPVHIINNTIDQKISSSSIATAPAIYIDNLGKFRSLGGTLYINGASVVDGSYSASQNELYHLTLVLSSPTSSALYLNGGNLVMNSTRSKGTYGYLQFWNSAPTAADILDRYSQFTGKTIVSITDPNTTKLYSALSKESYVITNLG
jgi:hypothetical protein